MKTVFPFTKGLLLVNRIEVTQPVFELFWQQMDKHTGIYSQYKHVPPNNLGHMLYN